MRASPVRRIRWSEAFRIISTRYPPIEIFERIADPADWEELIGIEELTNPRIRESMGEIARVPEAERVSGPGASWVMAAFTHVGRASRFSDGTYGVYYAARHLLTSVAETTFHFGRFLERTREPAGTELEMRVLRSADLDGSFHDIRNGFPRLHDPDDYRPSQAWAKSVRDRGSRGLVYLSVRRPGGFPCLAVFRAHAIPRPESHAFLRYRYDGRRISHWIQLGTHQDWQEVPGL
ncbi:MAG: RES family NAD+ phosphorylase [Myxococcota bacterium]